MHHRWDLFKQHRNIINKEGWIVTAGHTLKQLEEFSAECENAKAHRCTSRPEHLREPVNAIDAILREGPISVPHDDRGAR